MTVNMSLLAGAGWQFFSNTGVPLAGGKLATYLAGTDTPATTYTDSTGMIQNSNPIILDSAGRVPEEVWLTANQLYKFKLRDASDNLIWTKDNIAGINDFTEVFADFANCTDVTKGDALVAFHQADKNGLLPGSVCRTLHDKMEEFVSIKDFMPEGIDTWTTDCTTYIQAAIDGPAMYIYFPPGNYLVTTIDFQVAGKTYYFDNANIVTSNTATGYYAAVEITSYYQTFYNLSVYTAYNANYACAIWWHKKAGVNYYPEFIVMYNLAVSATKIGIIYGDGGGTGHVPIDAPVSENHIFGFRSRGTERVIFFNQPNGFLTITGGTLLSSPNEWPAGQWNEVIASCLEMVCGVINIGDSYLIKNTTQEGFGIVINPPSLTPQVSIANISNTNNEIMCCPIFVGDGGRLNITNWQQPAWANGTGAPFINTSGYGSEKAWIMATNVYIDGHPGYSANAIVQSNTDQVIARFTDSIFNGCLNYTMLTSAAAPYWTQADVIFKNCVGNDVGGDWRLSMADSNLADYYQLLDIAKFNVSAPGVGASATIVASTSPNFAKALQLVNVSGSSTSASTKINVDQAIFTNQRNMVFEASMQITASAENFNGRVSALYYDDAGTLVGTFQLGANDGSVMHLKNIAGAQGWGRYKRTIPVPDNASQLQLIFGVDSATTWQIAGIKVY